jgi:hypothetical protein
MGERRKSPEGVEGDRTQHGPDQVPGKSADANTPPEQQDYPPGKARLLDEDEDLASQSDDEPGLE